jgi:mercuric ion binding protein
MRKSVLILALLGAVLAAALLATPGQAQETKPAYTVEVDGLACPFCAYGIEKQLSAIEGVESVETDIKSGAVIVTMAPGSTLDEDAARKAVEAAGFTLRGFQGQGAGE